MSKPLLIPQGATAVLWNINPVPAADESKQQQQQDLQLKLNDATFIQICIGFINEFGQFKIDNTNNKSTTNSIKHIKAVFNERCDLLLSNIKQHTQTKLNDISILEVLYHFFTTIIEPHSQASSNLSRGYTYFTELLDERIKFLRSVPNAKVSTVNNNATLPNIPGDMLGLDNAIKKIKSNKNGAITFRGMNATTHKQFLDALFNAIKKVEFTNEPGLTEDTRPITLNGEVLPINKFFEEALALIQYADLCHDLTRNHKLARVYTKPPPTASNFYKGWLHRLMKDIITPTSVNQNKILILQHLIIDEFISALHVSGVYLYMPASQNDATIQSFVRDNDHYKGSTVTPELFTLLRSLGINGMYTESTMSDLASALWEYSITESQKMENFCLRAGRFDAGCGCGSLLEGTVNSGIGTQASCTSSCNYSESSTCHALTKFSAFEKSSGIGQGKGKKIIPFNKHSNDPGISPDVTMFFKYNLHIEDEDTLHVTCKDNPNLILEVRLTGKDGISLANVLSVLQLASTRGSTHGQIKSDVKMYITIYDTDSHERYPVYPHNVKDADKIQRTLPTTLPQCTHPLPFVLEKFIGETIPLLKTWTDFIQLITLLSYKDSYIKNTSLRKKILLIISDRSADSIQRLIGGGYTLHESKSDIILKCYDNRLRSVTLEALKSKVKIFSILASSDYFDMLLRATSTDISKLSQRLKENDTVLSRTEQGKLNILKYIEEFFMLKHLHKIITSITDEQKRIQQINDISDLSEFAKNILLLQDTIESYTECITSRNKHKSQWELFKKNIIKYMVLLEKIIRNLDEKIRGLTKQALLEIIMHESLSGHSTIDKIQTSAECQVLLFDYDKSVLERLLSQKLITVRQIQNYAIQILINKIMNELTNLDLEPTDIYKFVSLLIYSIPISKRSSANPIFLRPSSYIPLILVDKVLQTELVDNLTFNSSFINCLETLDLLIIIETDSTIKTYMDIPITRASTIVTSNGLLHIRMNPTLRKRLLDKQTEKEKELMIETVFKKQTEEEKQIKKEKDSTIKTLNQLQEIRNLEQNQDIQYTGKLPNNALSHPEKMAKLPTEMSNETQVNQEQLVQAAKAKANANAQSAKAYANANAQKQAEEQKQARQSSKRPHNSNTEGGTRKKHNRRKKIDTRKRQRKHKRHSRKYKHAAIRTSKARPASRRFR